MELTQKVIDIVDSLTVTDDEKQDFYVRWLESDKELPKFDNDQHLKNYCNEYIKLLGFNKRTVENNRARLINENDELIRGIHGYDDYDPGPEEQFIAADILWERLKLLSPLLRATAEMVLEGKTCDEVAEIEEVDVNTIYQRLHNARKILEETQ